jgi:hypothetical protein
MGLNAENMKVCHAKFGNVMLNQNKLDRLCIKKHKGFLLKNGDLFLPNNFELSRVFEILRLPFVKSRVVGLPLLPGQLLHVVPLPANLKRIFFQASVIPPTGVHSEVSRCCFRRKLTKLLKIPQLAVP